MSQVQMVTQVYFILIGAKLVVQAYLDSRNIQHIRKNSSAVPEKFADRLTLSEHQKAATYSIAKLKVGQFDNFIQMALLLLWTIGGGFEYLNLVAVSFGHGTILTGLIFFGLFGVISTLLSIPQSLYMTFVLEEKFGFNKMTPKIFIVDMLKGLILGVALGLPILGGILWIMEFLGNTWWIVAWAFLIAIQFILLWAYPRFIAPLFNKFSPLEEGETKNKVVGLLDKTGFTSNGLFVMDASIRSSHGNAYFTGFGKNKRIVFFDNLIKTLNPTEVEAVLAHELGHFKRKHIVKGLIKSTIFSFIGFYILNLLLHWGPFFLGHGVYAQTTYMALALFSLVSGIYTFFLTPLNAITSRKYEFEADEFAAKHADAGSLISALVKLYKDNASTLTPDPLYSAFYHSHPPALIRVKHLEQLS